MTPEPAKGHIPFEGHLNLADEARIREIVREELRAKKGPVQGGDKAGHWSAGILLSVAV